MKTISDSDSETPVTQTQNASELVSRPIVRYAVSRAARVEGGADGAGGGGGGGGA